MERYRPSDFTRWLRVRRKRRAAEEGYPVPVGDPDFYDPDNPPPTGPPVGFITLLLTLIVLAIVILVSLTSGGSTEPSATSPATTAPTVTGSTGSSAVPGTDTPASSDAPSSSEPTPDPLVATVNRILFELGLTETGARYEEMLAVQDLLNDLIDSIRSILPAYQGRDVDIARVITLLYESTQGFQDLGFNQSVYECGALDPLVVCPPAVLDMPAGTTLVLAMEVSEAIPVASDERAYRYSAVFDTDGDPANDWVYVDPFEWDYFQGADRWYQAVYDPTFGWTIEVTQLTADGSFPTEAAPSAVRAVIDDAWIVWFIPVDELGGSAAPYRVSAFAHDGAFTEETRGGDVLGPDPTGPLYDPPTAPVFVVEN